MSIKVELFDPAVPGADSTASPVTFKVEEYAREIIEVYAPAAVSVGGGSDGDPAALLEHTNTTGTKHAAKNVSAGPYDASTSSSYGTSSYSVPASNVDNMLSELLLIATEIDRDARDGLAAHKATTAAAKHAAADITVTATGAVGAGRLQTVIEGLDTRITTGASNHASHTNTTGNKHAAGNISTTAITGTAGNINPTNLQDALQSMYTTLSGVASGLSSVGNTASSIGAGLTAHENTTGNKHAASNISFAAGGTLSAGTVQSGIIALDARVTSLQKPTTYTAVLASERERLDLNFTMATTSGDLKVIYNNSKKVSWDNEWGALRGTSPYSWGDSLVRGVRENSDGITNGQFLQLEDRRTGANSNVMFGVNWTDGSIMRNGNKMADVWYRANDSVAIPANLPAGTIVITGAA